MEPRGEPRHLHRDGGDTLDRIQAGRENHRMKRDMDLRRKILFEIEKWPTTTGPKQVELEGYPPDAVGYNVSLLAKEGLIDGLDATGDGASVNVFLPRCLTPRGHDRLDLLRNDTTWNEAKGIAARSGRSVTINAMKTMTGSQLPVVTAFVSYSHTDREFGRQVKDVLGEIGIDAFLAHEDLETSEQWQERILSELRRCDLFVPLLSKNFLESKWAPQEAGFIASRLSEVVIVPLSIDGTTPSGFLSQFQSGPIRGERIARELLVKPLAKRFPRTILPGLIQIARKTGTFRKAEQAMDALEPCFPLFTAAEAQALAEASVRNSQIWSASLCRDRYLPEFIRVQRSNLEPETLRALQYQVENGRWYQVEGAPEANNTPKKDLKAWQVPGARTKRFTLHKAACLIVGDEPVWPLKTQRSIEEYNMLCECIRTEQLDEPEENPEDTLSFQMGFQSPEDLHIDRRTLRRYVALQNREPPTFLVEKYDKDACDDPDGYD